MTRVELSIDIDTEVKEFEVTEAVEPSVKPREKDRKEQRIAVGIEI